jgi:hypothetical protein
MVNHDQVGRAQRACDARRVPEEGRVRERAAIPAWDEHRVHEPEQVADVEESADRSSGALCRKGGALSPGPALRGIFPGAGSQPRLRVEVDLPLVPVNLREGEQ